MRETANAETVLVVRRGPDGAAVARSVNLSGVVTGEALDADIALQPLDIVLVPKTPISEAKKYYHEMKEREARKKDKIAQEECESRLMARIEKFLLFKIKIEIKKEGG